MYLRCHYLFGIGAGVTGEFAESDAWSLRRLIPFQNMVYLRRLFDQVQESAEDVLVN